MPSPARMLAAALVLSATLHAWSAVDLSHAGAPWLALGLPLGMAAAALGALAHLSHAPDR